MDYSDDPLMCALDAALAALTEARVRYGRIGIPEAPEGPILAVLSIDRAYKKAKARTKTVTARLRPMCSPDIWAEVLKFEAAIREENLRVIDVAFAVGLTATGRS